MKKNIPNIITSMNLLLGWTSIYFAYSGEIDWAVGVILLASFFDYLDGFAARKLNVQSALGTQLDSFADLVTFGIAPAVIVYFVSTLSLFFVEKEIEFWLFLILGFVPLLGAIRLARFNTVLEESSSFIGLPIPAFALITISLTWTYSEYNSWMLNIANYQVFLPLSVLLISFLMVSKWKFISLKIKNLNFKANKLIYLWVISSIICLVLLIIFGNIFLILPIVLFLYLLFSLINNFVS
ncbi:MAG: CDP-diacylglycerol--serine O-phosphatidyltransferase [Flavobacteriales bacterium]|nr:CDP-diacylglycerol--serine O-phosphatidyltransferase [Flavobacteriales bacterium]